MSTRTLCWLAVVVALAGCAQLPARDARAPLLDTYWRPVEIEGTAFIPRPGTREPHLVLSGEGNRVRGYTGCNNLAGAFEQDAGGFRFKPLATTRMACLPANDLEARFLSAVNATTAQRIDGQTLELLDKDGKVRMRLEGRPLK